MKIVLLTANGERIVYLFNSPVVQKKNLEDLRALIDDDLEVQRRKLAQILSNIHAYRDLSAALAEQGSPTVTPEEAEQYRRYAEKMEGLRTILLENPTARIVEVRK